jgi:hypothetical protein
VDAVWRRGVPERLYLAIKLPELDVMPIDELLGQPDCFRLILAIQVHSICDVPVLTNDVCPIALHLGLASRRKLTNFRCRFPDNLEGVHPWSEAETATAGAGEDPWRPARETTQLVGHPE